MARRCLLATESMEVGWRCSGIIGVMHQHTAHSDGVVLQLSDVEIVDRLDHLVKLH